MTTALATRPINVALANFCDLLRRIFLFEGTTKHTDRRSRFECCVLLCLWQLCRNLDKGLMLQMFGGNDDLHIFPCVLAEPLAERLENGLSTNAMLIMDGSPLQLLKAKPNGNNIRLLSLNKHSIRRIRKGASFYYPSTIPAGTYKWQKDDVQTLSIS